MVMESRAPTYSDDSAPSLIRAAPITRAGSATVCGSCLVAQVPSGSDQRLTPGNHIIRVKFAYDGGGIGKAATATLLVDEKPVAEGRIAQTKPARFSLDRTFVFEQETAAPVPLGY